MYAKPLCDKNIFGVGKKVDLFIFLNILISFKNTLKNKYEHVIEVLLHLTLLNQLTSLQSFKAFLSVVTWAFVK